MQKGTTPILKVQLSAQEADSLKQLDETILPRTGWFPTADLFGQHQTLGKRGQFLSPQDGGKQTLLCINILLAHKCIIWRYS